MRRTWVRVCMAVLAGLAALGIPSTADAAGEINYAITCTIPHGDAHGSKGEIFYYGTYPYVSHVVRSVYLTQSTLVLNHYVEVGQVFYKDIWMPTKHFYAYEDEGYFPGQRLYTYGNCTLQTWFSYYVEQNYPTANSWKVGRTSVPWATVTVHMSGGYPVSAMERSSTADDGHGSYQNLQYKPTGPSVWTPSDAPLGVWDADPIYKAVRKSYGSWYSTPS